FLQQIRLAYRDLHARPPAVARRNRLIVAGFPEPGQWRQGPSCPAGRGKIAGSGPRNSEPWAPKPARAGRPRFSSGAAASAGRAAQPRWGPRQLRSVLDDDGGAREVGGENLRIELAVELGFAVDQQMVVAALLPELLRRRQPGAGVEPKLDLGIGGGGFRVARHQRELDCIGLAELDRAIEGDREEAVEIGAGRAHADQQVLEKVLVR